MLTPNQYEAIGRLAIAFNEIEYMIEAYLMHTFGCPELGVSLRLIQRENRFGAKKDLFGEVLVAIRQEHPLLSSQIDSVIGLLGQASSLAHERDKYIHALAVQDFKTKRFVIRVKDKGKGKGSTKETICDEKAIAKLAADATTLAGQISTECGDLLLTLEESRELRS